MKKKFPNISKNCCLILLFFIVSILLCACGSKKDGETIKYINGLADLKGEKVIVTLGSTHDQFLEKEYPEVIPFRVESPIDIVPALQSGQVEVALLDGIVADDIINKYDDFVVVETNVFTEYIGMGFQDKVLLEEFNDFIREKKDSGAIQALVEKWEKNYETAEMPHFENSGANGTVVIGLSTIAPFVIFRDNEYVGMEMELLGEFLARKSLKMDIKTPGFAALITGISANKFDIIAGSITITEERKKQVNFSDSYYESYARLLVRKSRVKQLKQQTTSNLDELIGKKVGVLTGSTHDKFLVEHYAGKIEPFYLNSLSDAVPALLSQNIDAALIDYPMAKVFVREQPQLLLLPEAVFTEDLGFPFADAALCNEFNRFLAAKKASGKFDALVEKWENNYETAEMPKFNINGNDGTLVIGALLLTPFVFQREGGKYCGLEIELLTEFAASKNKKVKIVNVDHSSLLPAISAHKIDVACGGLTITEERKSKVNFSDAHYHSKATLVTLKNKAQENTRMGVFLGSSSEIFISKTYPNNEILRYDGVNNLVTGLLHGNCDIILLDEINEREVVKINPEITCLEEDVFQTSVHVITPKSKKMLMKQFDHFLEEYRASGELDKMVNSWKENLDREMPHIENEGKNGKLVIATEGATPPFTFMRNGKLAGIDIELTTRFAASIGKKPEYVVSNFSGVLAAVTTNKVDLGASFISCTEERAQKMNFSNPYCDVKFGFFGLEKVESTTNWWTSLKESFYNNLVKEKRYLLIIDGLKATIIISLLSILFGTLLAALVCYAKMSKNKILRTSASIYIDILRGVPQVVLLMIMFYVVFASSKIDGIWVASITFAMNFSAYVSEIFRTAIEGIDKGQTEAGIAMGFTTRKTFRLIIVPQAIKRVLPVFKGEIISLVKMTSIVGYIAVQDLTKAGDIIRSRTFDAFFPLIFIAILYFALSWGLASLFSLTEKKRKK